MTIVDSYVSYNDTIAAAFAVRDSAALADSIVAEPSPALSMPLAGLIAETNKLWRDLEVFFRRGDEASYKNAYRVLQDLTLTIAVRPARNWRQAKKKIVLLAEHGHAVRRNEPTFAAILDAVIGQECERWDIALLDQTQETKAELKH